MPAGALGGLGELAKEADHVGREGAGGLGGEQAGARGGTARMPSRCDLIYNCTLEFFHGAPEDTISHCMSV